MMRHGTESPGELRFPMIVKPRHESDSCGVQLVHEPAQLRQAVEVIVTRFAQDALVEEYIEGQEIWVALLGNEELEVLPLVEQDFGDRDTRFVTWEAKHMVVAAPPRICPARIGNRLATVLRDISVATFRACQCRDYARIDFRIDDSGQPFVLEINTMSGLGMTSAYVSAGTTAGYSPSSLVNRILDVAHRRYFGIGIR
ncbi:ATP-grasp domain-containing protein [Mesorhizobium sp.]|uniref:D-alanine--D-alanine ligase family protein n=1 Tax=Mesorhizobium sp. TaxID=1871066 RepID=UPI0025E83B39|nr:ATP-grasp domain-containing protein [Mesorhizobium sp.]